MKSKICYAVFLLLAGVLNESSAQSFDAAQWPHWVDTDGNGRDQRQDELWDEARPWTRALRCRGESCRVVKGEWICKYTGVRTREPSALEPDHVVPLRWVHQAGGAAWPAAKKRQFANDRRNLMLILRSEKIRKNGRAPWHYLPPSRIAICPYLRRWRTIVGLWRLRMKVDERAKLMALIDAYNCDRIATPARRQRVR